MTCFIIYIFIIFNFGRINNLTYPLYKILKNKFNLKLIYKIKGGKQKHKADNRRKDSPGLRRGAPGARRAPSRDQSQGKATMAQGKPEGREMRLWRPQSKNKYTQLLKNKNKKTPSLFK